MEWDFVFSVGQLEENQPVHYGGQDHHQRHEDQLQARDLSHLKYFLFTFKYFPRYFSHRVLPRVEAQFSFQTPSMFLTTHANLATWRVLLSGALLKIAIVKNIDK